MILCDISIDHLVLVLYQYLQKSLYCLKIPALQGFFIIFYLDDF